MAALKAIGSLLWELLVNTDVPPETAAAVEKEVEQKLKKAVHELDKRALCLKFESPGYSGVPDRIVFLPGGHIILVETKQPKKKERRRQLYVQGILRALGFDVFSAVDSQERIELVLSRIREVEDGSV